jgi:hypothetical protein
MNSTASLPSSVNVESSLALHQEWHIADRRSTVSIYLLCRVLMEIFGQSTLMNLTTEMADRLEDIIYKQLSAADPETLDESLFRQSNWVIFGQLLGTMSDLDFERVTNRYIADLQRMQLHLGRREYEGRAILVIRGMRWLKLKYQPESAWDQTCDFLSAVASIASTASGQTVKYAFNKLLEELLLPIAAAATSELNTNKWASVVDQMRPRLTQMLIKPKHWAQVFPVLVVVLCVSPVEAFSSHWLSLVIPLQQRLKERSTRAPALGGITRLVWTYIFRTSDAHGATIKNLTDVIRLVFIPGKKSYVSTDPDVSEPLIQLIRIIGFKYRDLCFRQIIFPLMSFELFSSGKDVKVSDLEPEKIVIGIRAFLAIMADLENGEHPPFPVSFENHPTSEPFRVASSPLSPRPPTDHVAKTTLTKEERLSRPVAVTGFDDITTDAYTRFCKILGDITLFCDNTFGGQAVLDEKFSQTPKTPIAEAFSFARREDQTQAEFRQGYYDLLHVAVQALPRCLSTTASKNFVNKSLVNLLCTGTAHVQPSIATSSVQSLKSIAKQGHAQQVTVGFARFIFNFDNRYSTMSDGGLLGSGHIESTLKLYVELLNIWIDEVRHKLKRVASENEEANGHRAAQLDLNSLWAQVDEIESHGLFFLSSPARRVRLFAVTVLRLVVEFDTALGKDSARVIRIMENKPQTVINLNDENLTVAERSRLQKALKKPSGPSPVIELCTSDAVYDATLWFKLFPNLVRESFGACPQAVTLTREIVCARISQMQGAITSLAEGARPLGSSSSLNELTTPRGRTLAGTAPDILTEQWRLYLVFACTTLTNTGSQIHRPASAPEHNRHASKSSPTPELFNSAGDLFKRVIPFLAAPNQSVRDAAVAGLGSINKNLYRTLLEALYPVIVGCNEEAKVRMNNMQRGVVGPRRSRRSVHLRTEIAHVYRLTAHFLQSIDPEEDEWVLTNLVNYTQELRLFLNDAEVQSEWEFHKLRTHFCGLMDEVYRGVGRTKDPIRWLSFQSRKAAFSLMEEWCGFAPNESQIKQREDTMRRSVLEKEPEANNKSIASAAMEIEKRDLRQSALSAMATLCCGPISIATDPKAQPHLSFNVQRVLEWIDSIFCTVSDKTQAIGRRALKNLIVHNKDQPYFLQKSLEMCYLAKTTKALESYFEVVAEVVTEREDFAPQFPNVLGASLFILGNENNRLRMKATRLLKLLELREYKISDLQELEVSISDKTIAVYKKAQFEISQHLAMRHIDLGFHVISEFSKFFKDLQRDQQRSVVAVLLPWIQHISLELDASGRPAPSSHMVLVNLFEITVRFGNALHNEIQACWAALASNDGNAQTILDFIISMCLDRKEQSFVDYARQIVVYLSESREGSKVVDFLLQQITPKAMVQEKDRRKSAAVSVGPHNLPYVADLKQIFPEGPSVSRHHGVSLGQLSLILLVDLLVSPTIAPRDSIPNLLHVVIILWDHYIPRVQDQAREMLVHLIHELVISTTTDPAKVSIENFIELIRSSDSKVIWTYEDYNGKKEDDNKLRVPEQMMFVTTEVVRIFSTNYPGIREELGKMALKWASNCHVIHLACRSFQLFRCILSSLEQQMLADMLARLSNTIADEGLEVQTFAMEILTTLKTIIEAFQPADLVAYPQLFWATCACLNTVHEREFMESLAMLDKMLGKLDLADPSVVQRLMDNKPPKWEGTFEGLLPLVYKGVRSSIGLERSTSVLEKLICLPPGDLIGDETGLLFAILASVPRYLVALEIELNDAVISSALNFARVAEARGLEEIAIPLKEFAGGLYRTENEFFSKLLEAFKLYFFPSKEFAALVFLLGLLSNKLAWFKIKVMQMLCMVIPAIDMRKPEISSKGPDLITPLLRLLQTEFCPQALAVLDNVMTMNATPMEHKHLRMSMLGAGSSKATRKEYEKTQSLYGIPEDSGWSIPMPAIHMHLTRSNMHAVFYTCATPGIAPPAEEATTPSLELVEEEYSDTQDSHASTLQAEVTQVDTLIGDLVSKLESLDDFFDDDVPEVSSGHGAGSSFGGGNSFHAAPPTPLTPSGLGSRSMAGSAVDMREHLREHLYEQQTYPLLYKSLTRNASVSSFQNGFSDSRFSPATAAAPRSDWSAVTPTHADAGAASAGPVRPVLQARTTAQGGVPASPPPLMGYRPHYSPTAADDSALAEDADAFLSDDDMPLAVPPAPAGSSLQLAGPPGNAFAAAAASSSAAPPYGTESRSPPPMPVAVLQQQLMQLQQQQQAQPQAQAQQQAQQLHAQQQQMLAQQQQQQQLPRLGRLRSGFRRLTGGAGDARAREAVRQQAERSPQVPKVPDVYLYNVRSGEV